MQIYYNRHYITIDTQGRVTGGWSDGPHRDRDTTEAVCINEEGGYQFRLWPSGPENPSLYTMDGIPLYKWDGEDVVARTEAEIAADQAARPGPPAPDVPLCLRPGVSPLSDHANTCRRAADGLVVVSVAVDTPGHVADLPEGYRPGAVVSTGSITVHPDGTVWAETLGAGTVCFFAQSAQK
jgi:hypothetical protein